MSYYVTSLFLCPKFNQIDSTYVILWHSFLAYNKFPLKTLETLADYECATAKIDTSINGKPL